MAAAPKPGSPGWKAFTQARWARNHPQPLFPSGAVTQKEQSGLLNTARSQVLKSYAATPLPTQQSYLQPFADAHARNVQAGQNYINYLQSAAGSAQNLSGAFASALGAGINTGQQNVQSQGGSGLPGAIPTAQASTIPAAAVGSSFTNYLNALQPSVGAAVNETDRQLNVGASKAAGDYAAAQAQRRGEVQDAIQKLYTSSLSTLAGQKSDAVKNAVAEYVALGRNAYQKAQLNETISHHKATEKTAAQNANTSAARLANTKAYQQRTLDSKRTAAAAKGIDLAPAYRTLFVTSSSTSGTGARGPSGQSGGNYTIVENRTDAYGDPAGSTTVTQFVPYGQKVPKSVRFTNPDGTTVTRKVTLKSQQFPPKGASSSTRKATPKSWDLAVRQLKAKYPGQITPAWLKSNFPPRPAGG